MRDPRGNAGTADASVRVDVVVCTTSPPSDIALLLGSLARQAAQPHRTFDLRVVVVVNRPEAGEPDQELPSEAPPVTVCVHEPRLGIPIARNTGLDSARSSADFVAFIDDDEVASVTWLDELLACQQRFDADVVAGPVIPTFKVPPPRWAVDGQFFSRPRRPDGSQVSMAYTGNVLLRARCLRTLGPRPFDERLALTGGSDRELSARLKAAGAAMYWADSAIVEESVPPNRATVAWVLQRSFRYGNNSALFVGIRGEGAAGRRRVMRRSVTQISVGMLGLLSAPFDGFHVVVERLRQVSFGLGGLAGALGLRYEEYRRTSRRRTPGVTVPR